VYTQVTDVFLLKCLGIFGWVLLWRLWSICSYCGESSGSMVRECWVDVIDRIENLATKQGKSDLPMSG